MKNIDLTPVLELVVTVASLLITTFLIPFLKSKLTEEQQKMLKEYVGIAVGAAEQLYGSKSGQQKKEYVVNFLLSQGLVFDIDEVTAMIENEVYKLTQEGSAKTE